MTHIINQYHHHYETNTKGRDFMCGDLQGMYQPLMNALKQLKFDKSIDRLFCVGDLIDRGPHSLECASLIYEPWFITTQGNHEQLMWQSILNQHPEFINCWIVNGGLWSKNEDFQLLYDIALRFKELPLVISVGKGADRFNIVHAEIIRNSPDFSIMATDQDIDDWTFSKTDMNDMLWGRTIVGTRTSPMSYLLVDQKPLSLEFQTPELSQTYCGHSIVPFRPVSIQRQIYLDTGCVNGLLPKNKSNIDRYPLTIACPQEKMFYCQVNGQNVINKYSYKNLRHYT